MYVLMSRSFCVYRKKCAAPYYPEAVSTPKSQVGLLAMTWILKHFIVYMYSLCFYVYIYFLFNAGLKCTYFYIMLINP